jgi:hypothetical protein
MRGGYVMAAAPPRRVGGELRFRWFVLVCCGGEIVELAGVFVGVGGRWRKSGEESAPATSAFGRSFEFRPDFPILKAARARSHCLAKINN